jgi:hypothetical protein
LLLFRKKVESEKSGVMPLVGQIFQDDFKPVFLNGFLLRIQSSSFRSLLKKEASKTKMKEEKKTLTLHTRQRQQPSI